MNKSDISIMTFNVKNSGDRIDRKTINRWENRSEKIVNIIRKYNPTIIGLQEVLKDQFQYLIDELDDYSYYGIGRDDGISTGEYNPIFSQKDLISVIDQGTFWLSDTPSIPSKTWEGCCTRICSWIKISKPVGLVIMNTHLDDQIQDTRLKSLEVINNWLSKLEDRLILMGDFNFTRESLEYRKIADNSQFKDCFLEGYKGSDITRLITYHGYTGKKYSQNNRFIDYIFTSEDLIVNLAEIIYHNQGGHRDTFPSDHWPVYVKLSLPY